MNNSFGRKLFLATSIVITFFWVISSAVFFVYSYKTQLDDANINMQNISVRTGSEIESLLNKMDAIAISISSSSNVRDEFSKASTSKISNYSISERIMPVLITALVPKSTSKFRIILYNRRGNLITTGLSYYDVTISGLIESEEYENWYKDHPILSQSGPYTCVSNDYWEQDELTTITLSRNIYHSVFINQSTGIIEIQCPIKYFSELMSDSQGLYNFSLADQNGNIIYSSPDYDATSNTSSINTSVNINEYGWTLKTQRNLGSLYHLLLPMMIYAIMFYLLTLGFCILFIYIMTRHITKPLKRLTNEIRNVSVLQPSLHLSFPDLPDEFDQLTTAFIQMINRLKVSMDENIKRETYEIQANMIALQSQMNPHFIYNILAVIKSQSLEGKNEQVELTCNYLAQMLRYISTYSEDNVPLSKELEHAELYLKLMKIRYEGSFEYSINVDGSTNNTEIMIPKLSIQPLLENCFKHAFKEVLPVWNISVDCTLRKTACFIEISDNGSGFDSQKILSINQKVNEFVSNPSDSIPTLSIGGMGLVNTLVRMKLNYHSDFYYAILPKEPTGTVIRFIFILQNDEPD